MDRILRAIGSADESTHSIAVKQSMLKAVLTKISDQAIASLCAKVIFAWLMSDDSSLIDLACSSCSNLLARFSSAFDNVMSEQAFHQIIGSAVRNLDHRLLDTSIALSHQSQQRESWLQNAIKAQFQIPLDSEIVPISFVSSLLTLICRQLPTIESVSIMLFLISKIKVSLDNIDDIKKCEDLALHFAAFFWVKDNGDNNDDNNSNNNSSDLLLSSLNFMFHILSTEPRLNNHIAFAPLMSLVSDNDVIIASSHVVDSKDIDDDSLSCAVHVLFRWLIWPNSRVYIWLLQILNDMAVAARFQLLIEISKSELLFVAHTMINPRCRSSCFLVLSRLLLGYQHSPLLFHKLCPFIAKLMHALSDNVEMTTKMAELLFTLMFHHAGYPEVYSGIIDILSSFSSPSEIEMTETLKNQAWVNSLFGGYKDDGDVDLLSFHSNHDVGLINLGNTCYLNSVVQALFSFNCFRSAVFNSQLRFLNKQSPIGCIQELFSYFSVSNKSAIEPNRFYDNCRPSWFGKGSQQDASEYLMYFIDCLTSEDNATSQNRFISDCFRGQLLNSCSCLNCQITSQTTEPFFDLSINVNNQQDVQESINDLFRSILLQDSDKYQCKNCNSLQNATKMTQINEITQCFVVTLLRFEYDANKGERRKLLNNVNINEQLTLKCNDVDHHYLICAVVVHSGLSPHSGHYYCYRRSVNNDQWSLLNDSRCSHAEFTDISRLHQRFPHDTPYLLLYELISSDGIRPQPAPVPPELAEIVEIDNLTFLQEQRKRKAAKSSNLFQSRHSRWENPDDDDDSSAGSSSRFDKIGPHFVGF